MPILDFFPQEKPINSLIQKDTDPSKYDAIAAKLCDKRIGIEASLKNTNDKEREALAISLIEMKGTMRTFGITEIDYQAYVAQRESKKDEPLPLSNIMTPVNNQTGTNIEDTFHD